MRRFVNRTKELASLEKQYASDGSSLVVVYGRRRVGKTALLSEFIKRHGDSLYFLATEESAAQNLRYFCAQAAELTGNPLLATAADWYTAFKALAAFPTQTKKLLVIDEFQYLGQSDSAFPSVLQKLWDTVLKDANVMLVLCGSLVSLMRSQTLDYGSPLYGRRTGQLRLRQIPFKYYHEFYDGRPNGELLPFYAVTGGVPKYIEAFRGYDDVFEGIRENVLDPQSFLYEEPYFLLQKEVSEIGSYFSLIKAIAMGNRKLSEIAAELGVKQTNLTKYLKVLIDLDLVEREVPVTETAPEKSKSGLYRITDNYIAFWFRFVYPYRTYLERGETEYVLSRIKEGFVQNLVSFVYEDVCRERLWEFSAAGEVGHFDKVGSYWGSAAGEVDIVAIDLSEKRLLCGECKYSVSPKGLSVLHELQKKGEALQALTGAREVSYVIFSTGGFTKGLLDEAKRDQSVRLFSEI